MESGLCSHVQEQIAAVRQQTTYQHPRGRGRGGYRGGYRGRGGHRGQHGDCVQILDNSTIAQLLTPTDYLVWKKHSIN